MITHLVHRIPNYPSNSVLAAIAMAELEQTSYAELKRIHCEVHGDVLRLSGCVSSFFHKQVAQESLLTRFRGQLRIENELSVAGKS